jgi:hypothetical protein
MQAVAAADVTTILVKDLAVLAVVVKVVVNNAAVQTLVQTLVAEVVDQTTQEFQV